MGKFKFIDGDLSYSTVANIAPLFNELKECLKSENIDLTIDDVMKAYDVFLRIVGIGKGYNSTNQDDFCEIYSICGVVECSDVAEKIKEGKIDPEIYKNIFDSINSIESISNNKFDNIEAIKDGLITLFKEFSIFTNDLFGYMTEFYKENNFSVFNSTYTAMNIDTGRVLSFSIAYNKDIESVAITIMSNILSDVPADKVSIIVDSFMPEVREKLLVKEKENTASEEEK